MVYCPLSLLLGVVERSGKIRPKAPQNHYEGVSEKFPLRSILRSLEFSGVFRESSRGGGTTPKTAHLVTLRAPGRKGATDTQCAAVRLQEKSRDVLASVLKVLSDFDHFLAQKGVKCYPI